MDCQEPVTGRRTGQLVLDYLTDAVLSHKPQLTGEPHVVPDSSLAVTVDTQNHVKIVVQKVTGSYQSNKIGELGQLHHRHHVATKRTI